MNREIKFRAWDQFYSKFIYSDKCESMSAFWAKVEGGRAAGREVPVQQYTGLKDKNGREIYKGDILLMQCGPDDGAFNKAKIPGEVVWDKNRFAVRLPDRKFVPVQGTSKGKEVSAGEMHSWVGGHTCLLVWSSKLEVIGDIYENPDLLA